MSEKAAKFRTVGPKLQADSTDTCGRSRESGWENKVLFFFSRNQDFFLYCFSPQSTNKELVKLLNFMAFLHGIEHGSWERAVVWSFLLLLVFPNSTDTHDETTQQSSNDMRVALTTVSECGLLRRNCLNIERENTYQLWVNLRCNFRNSFSVVFFV